jgi:hypothetical protein
MFSTFPCRVAREETNDIGDPPLQTLGKRSLPTFGGMELVKRSCMPWWSGNVFRSTDERLYKGNEKPTEELLYSPADAEMHCETGKRASVGNDVPRQQ